VTLHQGLALYGIAFSEDFNDTDKTLLVSSNIQNSIEPWLSFPNCETLPDENR
jgi:hypothetical protein